MSKSSFNSKTSSSHSDFHNERTDEPSYILDHSAQNEYTKYQLKTDMLNEAKLTCKTLTKRAMQKKAEESFFQEAIINILPHHKTKDIENLFLSLKKEFKTKAFDLQSVAIHRDEGVFVKTRYPVLDLHYDHNTEKWSHKGKDITGEVEVLRPGKTIFYNPADKLWYSSRKFEQKIDTSSLQKYYNLHAHAVYTRFDFSTGKNIRLDPADMSKIQDITARTLNMERGKQKAKIENLPEFYSKILKEIPPTDNLKDYKKAFIETSKMILKRDYEKVDERTERLEHYELKQRASVAEKPRVIEKEKVVEKERVVEKVVEKVVEDTTKISILRADLSMAHTKNSELEYTFREMQKRITALENVEIDQKKELHKLNTQANKYSTRIEELEQIVAELEARPPKVVEVEKIVEKIVEVEKVVIKEVEKVVPLEKIVKVEDTTKIKELETALKTTKSLLEDTQTALSLETQKTGKYKQNNTAILQSLANSGYEKPEGESFWQFLTRVFIQLFTKIGDLTKENAQLKKELAAQKPLLDTFVSSIPPEKSSDFFLSETVAQPLPETEENVLSDFVAEHKNDPTLKIPL